MGNKLNYPSKKEGKGCP